jgi:FkbM family methyltransferase
VSSPASHREPVWLAPLAAVAAPLRLYTHDPRRDLVSATLHRERCWEPFETALLLACLGPDSIVVDAGANLGMFSVAMACADRPARHVFAFEPAADNFALLRRNLRLNDCTERVTAVQAALGRRRGRGELHRSADNQGDHQLAPADGDAPRPTEPIDIVCGAEWLAQRTERIDLLKVDVQGSELAVLEGLLPLLRRSRSQIGILVELTPFALRAAGDSGAALIDLLDDLGLPLAIVDQQRQRLVPESADALRRWCENVDASPGDRGFMNIFAGTPPAALGA